MKKLLILINFSFIYVLQGQISSREINNVDVSPIDHLKIEVYKSIILSKEFKSNKQCHVVGINSVSLNMDYYPKGYSTGGSLGFYYTKLDITKDSVSVKELRKDLPKKYWIFEDSDRFFGVQVGADYIYNLKKNNIEYVPKNIDFEPDVCDFSFDIIKIYAPLDKWIVFYEKYYDRSYNSEVLIPVKYELLSNGNRSIEKEKYYLFKIKIGYNDKGKLEIIKEIISGGKEERDIIN
ncbi:hypothetical protein [Apibacter mensalis]|uniref:hypothetical protein n=1 Tax=Apibacter mensalis TaxID=1586267 RepID=UPI0026E97173|nr:hypothetical protein [Apibacter mensalis]